MINEPCIYFDDTEYPIRCDINVMEYLQEKLGTYKEWIKEILKAEERTVKEIFTVMVNEGLYFIRHNTIKRYGKIENDIKDIELKDVELILRRYNMDILRKYIVSMIYDSLPEEEEKEDNDGIEYLDVDLDGNPQVKIRENGKKEENERIDFYYIYGTMMHYFGYTEKEVGFMTFRKMKGLEKAYQRMHDEKMSMWKTNTTYKKLLQE